jgi:hypothetical protein
MHFVSGNSKEVSFCCLHGHRIGVFCHMLGLRLWNTEADEVCAGMEALNFKAGCHERGYTFFQLHELTITHSPSLLTDLFLRI